MGAVVAERVDRPLSLFDELEAFAPATAPERERAIPEKVEPAAPAIGDAVVWEDAAISAGAVAPGGETAESADRGAAQVRGGVGGEPTLDELIVGAWEGLTAQAVATCPICETGTLSPIYADAGGASPRVAGRCMSCGTTLS